MSAPEVAGLDFSTIAIIKSVELSKVHMALEQLILRPSDDRSVTVGGWPMKHLTLALLFFKALITLMASLLLSGIIFRTTGEVKAFNGSALSSTTLLTLLIRSFTDMGLGTGLGLISPP